MGEVRYSSLQKKFPEQAEALFAKTERDAMDKLAEYRRLASYRGSAGALITETHQDVGDQSVCRRPASPQDKTEEEAFSANA